MTRLAGRDGRRRRAGDLGREASRRASSGMGDSDRCGHLFFVFAGVMIVEEVRDGAGLRDARSNAFHVCGCRDDEHRWETAGCVVPRA